MHKKNDIFLRCVKCLGKINLEIFIERSEICEGFIICSRCKEKYPIIDNVPIWLSKGTHKAPIKKPNIPITIPEVVGFNLLGKKSLHKFLVRLIDVLDVI